MQDEILLQKFTQYQDREFKFLNPIQYLYESQILCNPRCAWISPSFIFKQIFKISFYTFLSLHIKKKRERIKQIKL